MSNRKADRTVVVMGRLLYLIRITNLSLKLRRK